MFGFGTKRGEEPEDLQLQTENLPRELRLALWMRQITLEYQPIVDLATGHLAGVEAYLRWDRPGQGVIPARAFVDEAASALVALDQEMLWVSTSLWASLGGSGAHVPLHVNVGVASASGRLSGLVNRALTETTLDPALIHVDVPDAILPGDAAVKRSLEGLVDARIPFALDDSGELSPADLGERLTQLPFHRVKVNTRAGDDPDARVAAIAAIAAERDVEVAAKQIEDAAGLDRGIAAGAQLAQGYLFGRPMAPEACVGLVMAERRARTESAA